MLHLCMCVCVCVCERERVCAHVRVNPYVCMSWLLYREPAHMFVRESNLCPYNVRVHKAVFSLCFDAHVYN